MRIKDMLRTVGLVIFSVQQLVVAARDVKAEAKSALENGATDVEQVPELQSAYARLQSAAQSVVTTIRSAIPANRKLRGVNQIEGATAEEPVLFRPGRELGKKRKPATAAPSAPGAIAGTPWEKAQQIAARVKFPRNVKIFRNTGDQLNLIEIFKDSGFPIVDSPYYNQAEASVDLWMHDRNRAFARRYSTDNIKVLDFLIANFDKVDQTQNIIQIAKMVAEKSYKVVRGQIMVNLLHAISNLLWLHEIARINPKGFQQLVTDLARSSDPKDKMMANLIVAFRETPLVKSGRWNSLTNDAKCKELVTHMAKAIPQVNALTRTYGSGRRLSGTSA